MLIAFIICAILAAAFLIVGLALNIEGVIWGAVGFAVIIFFVFLFIALYQTRGATKKLPDNLSLGQRFRRRYVQIFAGQTFPQVVVFFVIVLGIGIGEAISSASQATKLIVWSFTQFGILLSFLIAIGFAERWMLETKSYFVDFMVNLTVASSMLIYTLGSYVAVFGIDNNLNNPNPAVTAVWIAIVGALIIYVFVRFIVAHAAPQMTFLRGLWPLLILISTLVILVLIVAGVFPAHAVSVNTSGVDALNPGEKTILALTFIGAMVATLTALIYEVVKWGELMHKWRTMRPGNFLNFELKDYLEWERALWQAIAYLATIVFFIFKFWVNRETLAITIVFWVSVVLGLLGVLRGIFATILHRYDTPAVARRFGGRTTIRVEPLGMGEEMEAVRNTDTTENRVPNEELVVEL